MIEIGDYIRTKDGYIAKIIKNRGKDPCFHNYYYYDIDIPYQMESDCYVAYRIYEDLIVKHSKNIIDLIEAGDFANGYAVRMINNKLCNFDLNTMEWEELERIKLDGLIETIVTKEQFERASYKV